MAWWGGGSRSRGCGIHRLVPAGHDGVLGDAGVLHQGDVDGALDVLGGELRPPASTMWFPRMRARRSRSKARLHCPLRRHLAVADGPHLGRGLDDPGGEEVPRRTVIRNPRSRRASAMARGNWPGTAAERTFFRRRAAARMSAIPGFGTPDFTARFRRSVRERTRPRRPPRGPSRSPGRWPGSSPVPGRGTRRRGRGRGTAWRVDVRVGLAGRVVEERLGVLFAMGPSWGNGDPYRPAAERAHRIGGAGAYGQGFWRWRRPRTLELARRALGGLVVGVDLDVGRLPAPVPGRGLAEEAGEGDAGVPGEDVTPLPVRLAAGDLPGVDVEAPLLEVEDLRVLGGPERDAGTAARTRRPSRGPSGHLVDPALHLLLRRLVADGDLDLPTGARPCATSRGRPAAPGASTRRPPPACPGGSPPPRPRSSPPPRPSP